MRAASTLAADPAARAGSIASATKDRTVTMTAHGTKCRARRMTDQDCSAKSSGSDGVTSPAVRTPLRFRASPLYTRSLKAEVVFRSQCSSMISLNKKSREGIRRVRRANMQPAERQLADFAQGIRQNNVWLWSASGRKYCGSGTARCRDCFFAPAPIRSACGIPIVNLDDSCHRRDVHILSF
jgi:hypothetical protein